MNPLSLLHLPDFIRSQIKHIVLGLITGICILTGVGFLLAALWQWLATQTEPLMASLIIGAGLLVFSAIGFLINREPEKPDHERDAKSEPEPEPEAKLSLKTIAALEAGKGDAVAVLIDAFALGSSTYRNIRNGR